MKTTYFLIFMIAASDAAVAQISIRIWITPKNTSVVCEPYELHIAWSNEGESDIRIGEERRPNVSSAMAIWINQKQFRMPITTELSGETLNAPEYLRPGEIIEATITTQAFGLKPGKYRIQAIADFGDFPIGYFKGKAESNIVDFNIRNLTVKDFDAFKFAEESVLLSGADMSESLSAICWKLSDRKILKDYENSIYSAWTIMQSIESPENYRPVDLLRGMYLGEYPLATSVPDPDSPSGWREISGGKSMAQWQNEWANRILKAHPDFPFANRLRLVTAINDIALGKKETGVNSLREIATSDESDEAKWAKSFLAVY